MPACASRGSILMPIASRFCLNHVKQLGRLEAPRPRRSSPCRGSRGTIRPTPSSQCAAARSRRPSRVAFAASRCSSPSPIANATGDRRMPERRQFRALRPVLAVARERAIGETLEQYGVDDVAGRHQGVGEIVLQVRRAEPSFVDPPRSRPSWRARRRPVSGSSSRTAPTDLKSATRACGATAQWREARLGPRRRRLRVVDECDSATASRARDSRRSARPARTGRSPSWW